MHTRKAALVGCPEGPWVNTSTMKGLKLEVKGKARVMVQQRGDEGNIYSGAYEEGFHELSDQDWAKVSVVDGDPTSALCFLTTAP